MRSMAFLELASAPAWARIVASNTRESGSFSFGKDHWQLSGRTVLTKEIRHQTHRFVDMVEEGLVPRTQVVQTVFPCGRLREAILGATTTTGKPDLT